MRRILTKVSTGENYQAAANSKPAHKKENYTR